MTPNRFGRVCGRRLRNTKYFAGLLLQVEFLRRDAGLFIDGLAPCYMARYELPLPTNVVFCLRALKRRIKLNQIDTKHAQ